VPVVQVKIVLVDPTLLQLQVGVVVVLSADGHQDAGRLSGFENQGDSVGFAVPQVLLSKIISALFLGCVQDGSAPFLGSILQPVLELIGDFRQGPPGHPSSLSIGIKKPKYSLWLLERLDQSVQQDSIKAPIPELDAILVMRDEGVHSAPLCGEIPGAFRYERLNAHRFLVVLHGQLTADR